MGCCTGRCFLITICVLQLISTVQRQVFDFLGYMWAPIIANFLQIIFIIIGLFGACQYRPKFVIVYAVWCLLWLGWNVFVICIYLEVGILNRDTPILNIGTGYKSWWLENGIGCTVSNNYTHLIGSSPIFNRKIPPESAVSGCLLPYYYVEIVHAGVQCLLVIFGFITACYVVRVFTEEDDSSQPVNDELEYIKMRYKSPARSSFRDNRTYETLNRSTLQTTLDRHHGIDRSQTDIEAYSLRSSGTRGRNYPNVVAAQTPRPHYDSNLPWVRISPSPQRHQGNDHFDQRQDYINQTDYLDQESLSSSPPPSYHQYGAYDVGGMTHGVTVI